MLGSAGRILPRWTAAAACVAMAVGLSACGGHRKATPRPAVGTHAPLVLLQPPIGRRRPRGLRVVLRGGGWFGPDGPAALAMQPVARFFRRRGYATVIVDYRAGALGLADILAAYDQQRRRLGPSQPVCALGESAGGSLALLLAARRPEVRCVIGLAAPTSLPRLARERGGAVVGKLAHAAFGSRVAAFSPDAEAAQIRAVVLLVNAINDPYIPLAQARDFVRAKPGTRTLLLPAGNAPFVHSSVDAKALRRSQQAEARFLLASTRP